MRLTTSRKSGLKRCLCVKLAVLADRGVSPREERILRDVDGEYRQAEDLAQARESRLIKRGAA